MRKAGKEYSTSYKKKIDVHRDSFVPSRTPKGTLRCAGCGAFFYRRRWTLKPPPAGEAMSLAAPAAYCPACNKIKQHSASGELHLIGMGESERGEVVRILRNEEARAQEKNPLERIMSLRSETGNWRVETTTEKLAQRLGRSVRKARGGQVAYKWSHNNKFVRVTWRRNPPEALER
jgi:hypothetical protein